MLDVPIEDLISLLFIMISIIITIMLAKKAYSTYREKGGTLTLIIMWASLFIALAMFFLVLEQIFLSDALPLYNEFLGMSIFGATATVISGFAVVSFDAFAFKMVFSERAIKLTLITALATSVYVIVWLVDPTRRVENGEIVFEPLFGLGYPFTPLLSYIILIPLFSIPIFVLLYYTIKVRKENPFMSKRSGLLCLGGTALATAYTVELLGLESVITTAFRSLFIFAGLLFYIALFKLKSKEQ